MEKKKILEDMLTELFPQMIKNSIIQIQEDQVGFTHLPKHKQSNRHITVELLQF